MLFELKSTTRITKKTSRENSMPRKTKEASPSINTKKKSSSSRSTTKRTPKSRLTAATAEQTTQETSPPATSAIHQSTPTVGIALKTTHTPHPPPSQVKTPSAITTTQIHSEPLITPPSTYAYGSNIAPPSVANSVKETPKSAVYHEEIAKMMYTFGDTRAPLYDSVALVENFVRHYLMKVVKRLKEIALQQRTQEEIDNMLQMDQDTSSKAKSKPKYIKIELEHLIFLFRKNENRLSQILKSIRVKAFSNEKDIKENTSGIVEEAAFKEKDRKKRKLEDGDLQFLDNKVVQAIKRLRTDVVSTLVEDISDDEADDMDLETSSSTPTAQLDMLKLQQMKEEEITRKQFIAADNLTKKMSVEEYMDYARSREASFTFHNTKKFNAWLELSKKKSQRKKKVDSGKESVDTDANDNLQSLEFKFDDNLTDILGHIAWETVGLLTQTALIVKRDMNMLQYLKASGPALDQFLSEYVVEKNIGLATGVMDMELRNALTNFPHEFFKILDDPSKKHLIHIYHISHQARRPIEPIHIIEAARRLSALKPNPVDFTYNNASLKYKYL